MSVVYMKLTELTIEGLHSKDYEANPPKDNTSDGVPRSRVRKIVSKATDQAPRTLRRTTPQLYTHTAAPPGYS